jgi:hypothetical protein
LDLSNYYAKAPTSTYFNNQFSIIFWFNKYFELNSNANLALFDFSLDNSRNIGLEFLNNEIIFFAKNSTGSIIKIESYYKINNQQWYHIALTYSNNSRLIYLYINGEAKIIKSVDLVLGETNLNYIGRSDTLNINGSKVRIDEIRIYNRVLNSNEIFTDSKDGPIIRTKTTLDKCQYRTCYNGGTCYTSYGGDIKCLCRTNYYGDFCEKSNFFLNIILNFT